MVKPSSKLRDRLKEATLDAIIETTEAVFAKEGLQSARVEHVAALAGVSIGTLYNYTGDRDGLVKTLMSARQTELLQRLDDALVASVGQPFDAQVLAYVTALLSHYEAHARFFAILWDAESARETNVPMKPPKALLLAIHERTQALMARGLASGALPVAVAELAPTLLMGIVRAAAMRGVALGDEQLARHAPMLTDFFLRGAGVERVQR